MVERTVLITQHSFEPSQAAHSILVMPDSKGGICVKFPGIDEHKLMEDTNQRSEEKFSKAFRCSPASMCIVDIDNNYCLLDVNEAFEGATGYRREEVVGESAMELGLFGDPHGATEMRRRLLEEGRFRNLEAQFNKKNGESASFGHDQAARALGRFPPARIERPAKLASAASQVLACRGAVQADWAPPPPALDPARFRPRKCAKRSSAPRPAASRAARIGVRRHHLFARAATHGASIAT
jgi:PAS domain S-box-containing protein